MGDSARAQVETVSFRVAGFLDILDWRPVLFQEPIIAQRACALCGVVYKKAVRLSCVHTLCLKCHAKCVDKGSVCPVDQEPFCEEDVEKLEVSVEYILKRKVACWNAPRGCCFIGSAANLLDHYKECHFSVVSCCLCHSSVSQGDILEHFKSGCSFHEATFEPAHNPTTQDLGEVTRACLEMKKAMGRIGEEIMSLKTSLNRCCEDIRATDATAMKAGSADSISPKWYACGYRVGLDLELRRNENGELHLNYFFTIHPGSYDSDLGWPFNKLDTEGFVCGNTLHIVLEVKS
ncbi:hypothetical protein HPB47_017622 [Ixodes persulcatus]|uniref:Uncharacterized protein n=1 Tax=Ixodes persulcatus TaxID=34615 RepID=A0AC60QN05_IXOPE|nr:hypothetical protein HPB47_017622 [Ixodes persulcatus]